MEIGAGAALGHPGADFGVSGHPPAPILGEKVMQNCSRNLCTTLRKIFTHTPATCSHSPLPEHVSTQLLKKPAVPQLRGNAFRQKHLLCSNLLCQGFSARRTGRKPTWITSAYHIWAVGPQILEDLTADALRSICNRKNCSGWHWKSRHYLSCVPE